MPVFKALTVVTTPIAPKDQLLSFSVALNKSTPTDNLSLVLINGQNTPLVQPIQNLQVSSDNVATFQASFPYTANVLDGLTIAALTSTGSGLTSAEDVAKVTIAGPGLIEVN